MPRDLVPSRPATSVRWLVTGFLAAAVAMVAVGLVQRRETEALRAEVTLLQMTARERARLEEENRRLLAAQPAPDELERLKSDRAALMRLRAEIDALKSRAERK